MEEVKQKSNSYKQDLDQLSISWENEIRSLVRLTSLTLVILLIFEYLDKNNELIFWLKTILYVIFVSGLILVFFQMRWINERRNKITNFGYLFATLGLFLLIIPSSIQLFFENIYSSADPNYLALIFVLGVIFLFIGIFFETTRLDEPFIYWIKANALFVARLIIFSTSLLIMFYGYLNWDFSYNNLIPTFLFGLGFSFGIVSWLNHPFFKLMGTALNVLVSFLGYMIFYSLNINLLVYTETTSNTGLFLILFGLVANVILWSETILNFVIRVITYIIDQISKLLNGFISLIKDLISKINHSIKRFIQFFRDHYKTILRSSFTMIGIFLIYLGIITFIVDNQVILYLGQEIGTHARGWWLLAIGIGVIYISSLSKFNQIFNEIYRDFKNGIINFIAWIKLNMKEILLYSTRILGVLSIIFGFVFTSLEMWLRTGMILAGIVILGVTWRTQINHILIYIYQETVKAGKLFIAWFQLHRKKIQLYSTRIIGFLSIIFGFVFTSLDMWLRTVMILVGIVILGVTWRTQIKHILIYIYQETIKAGKLFIAWFLVHRKKIQLYSTRIIGFLSIIFGFVFTSLDKWLRTVMILAGIVILGVTWRTQIKYILIYIYKETVKTGTKFFAWLKLHRKKIRLYSTRILGILFILTGLVIEFDLRFMDLGTIVFGIILISSTWYSQIKNTLINTYQNTIMFAKEFFAWLKFHRKKIRLYSTRILGVLFILTGLIIKFDVQFMDLAAIVFGIILISSTWYTQIKNILINTYQNIIISAKEFIALLILYRKKIRLYSTRILGVLFILTGLVIEFDVRFMDLGTIVFGIILIFSTWYTQIKNILINAYQKTIISAKELIAWLILHRKIIRLYSTRILGILLILFGLVLDLGIVVLGIVLISSTVKFLDLGIVVLGIVLISSTWYTQIKNTLINTYQKIIKIGKEIIESIVQAIRNLIKYLQDNFNAILRYSITLIGSFLLVIGIGIILITNLVSSDYTITFTSTTLGIYIDDISFIGWLSSPIGSMLLYGVWYKKINSYLLNVFRKILGFTNQLLMNLKVFTSKALIQLKNLLISIADSIIPLSVLVVSFTAIIYGIILILSGVFDPSGDWTIGIMNLPLVEQISIIIQLDPDPKNLLGVWADPKVSFSINLIILGIGFSIVGCVLSLLIYLRFEKLKISNFTTSSQES